VQNNLTHAKKNEKLAFGYSSCMDIYVNAVDLMPLLGYKKPPTKKISIKLNSI
jgi:hypothetical protein